VTVVCPGTYHEQVVIRKPVSLEGRRATIDQAGVNPGLQLPLPGFSQPQTIFAAVVIFSSDVKFSGFKVTHAQGEGILAAGLGAEISGISISHSAVVHNDLGFGVPTPKSTYFEELSGVTFHAHTLPPGMFEDLSGNKVIGNSIGKNNTGGDPLDCPPGSTTCSPQDLVTTGILVFSGGTPVTTTIAFNHIFDNAVGIWLSKAVTASGLKTNTFTNVTTPISAGN